MTIQTLKRCRKLTSTDLAFLQSTMNYGIHAHRLQQSVTMPPMCLESQWLSEGWLPNMHARHPLAALGQIGILGNVSRVLLAEHAHTVPHHCHDLQEQFSLLV